VKINISNLSQGTHDYELSKSATDLGLAENFLGDVTARVMLEKSSRQIFLRAHIAADAVFHCDRCLEEFRKEVAPTLQTLYVWNAADRPGNEDEEVRVLTSDTNMIDISTDARESVLLAIPLKLLCKEECAGLCQRCGRNLNHTANGECDCAPNEIDPRWNKLAGFVEVSMLKKRN
jgi:uncharacterized protein